MKNKYNSYIGVMMFATFYFTLSMMPAFTPKAEAGFGERVRDTICCNSGSIIGNGDGKSPVFGDGGGGGGGDNGFSNSFFSNSEERAAALKKYNGTQVVVDSEWQKKGTKYAKVDGVVYTFVGDKFASPVYAINVNGKVRYATICEGATGADCGGATADNPFAVREPSATISATNCTIASGYNSCNSLLTWQFYDSPSPSVVKVSPAVNISTEDSGTNIPHTVTGIGGATFQAKDSTDVLASASMTTTCITPSTWSGYACRPTSVITADPTSGTGVPSTGSLSTNSIVRSGSTATFAWNISSLDNYTCTITGPGFSTYNLTTNSGSINTAPILNKSVYTLRCQNNTIPEENFVRQAIIEVIPTVREV